MLIEISVHKCLGNESYFIKFALTSQQQIKANPIFHPLE
jgi:hypothetical protein